MTDQEKHQELTRYVGWLLKDWGVKPHIIEDVGTKFYNAYEKVQNGQKLL